MIVEIAVPMTVAESYEIESLPDNWAKMSNSQQVSWTAQNGELLDVSEPQDNGQDAELTGVFDDEGNQVW